MTFGGIAESDWSLASIRAADRERADRLSTCGPPEALTRELQSALWKAMERHEFRIAIDSKDNAFIEQRAIVQFRVDRETYDWFFNAKTGYRAQFWLCPFIGIAFNKSVTEALSDALLQCLPQQVCARRIKVVVDVDRTEADVGCCTVSRKMIRTSFATDESKIWIAERRYDGPDITEIGFAVLSAAERCLPKLCVPRWVENPARGVTGEGLRAPYPEDDHSWLDLKGCFVSSDGEASQIKPQKERAEKIHNHGWT